MPNEYIHYIKRKVVTRYPNDLASPWFSELQSYENGFNSPVYHVTRSTSWPATIIKEGDVIWLVGQLSSPWGKLSPSIDARIEVESVEKIQEDGEKEKLRYLASANSQWFPLSDASKMLSRLHTVAKDGKISIPYNPQKDNIGQAFQSLRKISSEDTINEFAINAEKAPFDFISYRIVDGTKAAFLKVKSLVGDGGCIFWDRWSLPRRLAERRELVSDAMLDLLLTKKIEQASVVWGIETPKYSEENSYSATDKKRYSNYP